MKSRKAGSLGMAKLSQRRNETVLDQQAWNMVYNNISESITNEDTDEYIEFRGKTKDQVINILKNDTTGKYTSLVNSKESYKKAMPAGFVLDPKTQAIDSSHKLINIGHFKTGVAKEKDKKQLEILDRMKTSFFEKIEQATMGGTSKQQTGAQLQTQNVGFIQELAEMQFQENKIRSNLTPQEIINAHNNIRSGADYIEFDTETLGGTNHLGVSTFDSINEVAYIQKNGTTEKTRESFLMGLLPDQKVLDNGGTLQEAVEQSIKNYQTEVESILKRTDLSSRDNVVRKHFGMMGHGKTDIQKTNGLHRIVSAADLGAEEAYSEADVRAGLNRIINITRDYYSTDAMPENVKAYAKFVSILGDNNTISVTQNGTLADMPWVNTMNLRLQRIMDSTGLGSAYSIATNGITEVNKTGKHMDTLALFRQGLSDKSKGVIHAATRARDLLFSGKGVFAQEGIRNSLGLKGVDAAAHTAIGDTDVMDSMLNKAIDIDGKNMSLVDYAIESLKANQDLHTGTYTVKGGNQNLFIGNRNMSINDTSKGVFSFWRDASSNEIRLASDFTIGDTARRSNMTPSLIKKDMFYTLDTLGKLDMTSEEGAEIAKQFAGHFDEADVPNLYFAKINPVYDKSVIGVNDNLESARFVVANSEEQLRAHLENHLGLVGEVGKEGRWQMLSGATEAEKARIEQRLSTAVVKRDGTYQTHGFESYDRAIKRATKIEAGDRLRRSHEKFSMFQYQQYMRVKDALVEQYGEEYSPNVARRTLNHIMQNKDLKVAQQVASGEALKLDFSMINDLLTWDGSDPLSSNFETNFLQSYDHFEKMEPLARQVLAVIDEAMPMTDAKDHSLRSKRSTAFEYMMKDVLSLEVDKMIEENPKLDPRELYAGTKSTQMFQQDIFNTFTFQLPGYVDKTNDLAVLNSPNGIFQHSNAIEIDFSKNKSNEYALINQIMGLNPKAGKNVSGPQLALTQRAELNRFVQGVIEDGKYAGMFDNLEQSEHPVILAENILGAVKSYKDTAFEEHKTGVKTKQLGMPERKYTLDLKNPNKAVSSFMSRSQEAQTDIIKRSLERMPEHISLKEDVVDSQLQSYVDDFINNKLFSGFKSNGKVYDNAFDYGKAIGLTDAQAKMFRLNYEGTKESYSKWLTDYTKSLGRAGATLEIDKEGSMKFMLDNQYMFGGKSLEEMLPSIQTKNGQAYIQQGTRRFSFHGKLDFGRMFDDQELAPGNLGKITTISNMQAAMRQSRNFFPKMEKAVAENRVEDQALAMIKQFTGKLGQESTIGYSPSERKSMVNFDFSELKQILPMAEEQGYFEGVTFREKGFLDVVRKMRDNSYTSSEMNQTLQKDLYYALQIVADKAGLGGDVRDVLKHLRMDTKDKVLLDGVGTIDYKNHVVGMPFDNMGRPVPYSATKLKSKDKLERVIKESGKTGYIHVDGMLSSEGLDKFTSQELEHVGKTTNTVIAGKINMANSTFRDLQGELLKRYPEGSEEYVILKRYLDQVNLFEQEKLISAEFIDDFFSETQLQMLSKSRSLYYADNDLAVAEAVTDRMKMAWDIEYKDGKPVFKYGKGVDKKRGELLGVFEGQTKAREGIMANFDGRLKTGFIEDGIVISEDIINSKISHLDSADAAIEYVQKTFGSLERSFLESTSANERRKFLNGQVEKDMARSLIVGLGEYDPKVSNYLTGTKSYQQYVGKRVNINMVDEIVNGFQSGFGFESADELREAIRAERYFVDRQLKDFVSEKFNFNHEWSMIANHDNIKHNNVMFTLTESIETMRMLRMQQGENFETATKNVADQIIGGNLFDFGGKVRFENGKIYLPDAEEYKYTDRITTGLIDILRKDKDNTYASMVNEDGLIGIRLKSGEQEQASATFTMTSIQEGEYHQYASSSETHLGHVADTQAKITDLSKKIDNTKDPVVKEQLKEQKRLLQDKQKVQLQAINDRQNQRKFGTRDIELIGQQRVDSQFLKNLELAAADNTDEKLQEIIGSYDYDRDQGKKVLSKYLDVLDKNYYMGKAGDQTVKFAELEDGLKKRYADPTVRDNIGRIMKGTMTENGLTEMAYSRAEAAYTLTAGKNAYNFNNKQYITSQDMKELDAKGFKRMSISEIFNNTQINPDDLLNDENAIYGKNVVLDLSKYFGASGTDSYLAMPYTSVSVSGDELIRKNFQKNLGQISKYAQEVEDLKPGTDEYNTAMARLRSSVQKTKSDITGDLYGKAGVYGQNTYSYVSGSMYGTADITNFFAGEGKENYGKLKDFKFNGTSLQDHMDKERFLDAAFVNDEAFRRMGMYEEEFLKGQFTEKQVMDFAGKAELEDYQNLMREKLRTEGIKGDIARYPTIMRQSSSIGQIYLDESLSDQEIRTMGYSWLAKNGDVDSDNAMISIVRDTGGNVSVSDNFDKELSDQLTARMYATSVSENRYYQDKAMKGEADDVGAIISRTDYIAAAQKGDPLSRQFGYIAGTMTDIPDTELIERNNGVIQELIGKYQEAGYGEVSGRFDLTDSATVENLGNMLNSMEAIDQDRFRNAIYFDQSLFRAENYQHNKMGIGDVGQINNPLFMKRRKLNLLMDTGQSGVSFSQREQMQDAFYELEQAVISSKKIKDARTALTKTQEITDILRNIDSNDEKARYQAQDSFRSWVSEYGQDLDKVVEKHSGNSVVSSGEAYKTRDELVQGMIDTFEKMASPDGQAIMNNYKVGTGNVNYKGAGSYNPNNIAIVNGSTNLDDNLANMMNHSETLRTIDPTFSKPKARFEGLGEATLVTESSGSNAGQAATKMVKSFVEGTGKIISEAFSGNRKLGVLTAIAAGVGVAGVVGGNPSVPADTQAHEMSNQEQPPMQSPASFTPQAVPTNSGYVVNVRGKGSSQQITNTAQSLQNAMGQSFAGNINISMNVMSSPGGVSNRQLEQMISDAIG